MTELFLDKERVHLSDNISIKIVTENPYFTKSGSYTLNISLSLKSSENKRVFSFINRPDVSKKKKTFEAVLIADSRVVINGTATITEVTEEKVSIQILGGNAEMNFHSTASKLYIDELDLGVHVDSPGEFLMTEQECIRRFTPLYGDGDAIFSPIVNSADKVIYNHLSPVIMLDGRKRFIVFENYARFCIQPYLCAIIRRVIVALGYTLSYNEIEDSVFKNLFVCNATVSMKFAEALPHWTVNEFLTELENFLGVVILVHEGTRKVKIIFAKTFYNNAEPFCLKDVTDDFTCNIDDESSRSVSDGNVGYNLDWDDISYQQLSKEIMDLATIKKYNTLSEIYSAVNSMSEQEKGMTIFETNSRQYIFFRTDTDSYIDEVNKWRSLIRDQDKADLDVQLNIIPAKIVETGVVLYEEFYGFDPQPGENNNERTWKDIGELQVYMPRLSGLIYSSEDKDKVSLQNILEKSTNSEKAEKTKMQVSFSGVYRNFAVNNILHSYPVSWVDSRFPIGLPPKWSLKFYDEIGVQCLGSVVHQGFDKINTTVEETKSVASKQKIDPTRVMIINGKRYVCKQVELTVTGKGIEPIQKIVVYELVD